MPSIEIKCPSNSSVSLNRLEDAYVCSADSCTCRHRGRRFPINHGIPFLIDSETSIISQDDHLSSRGDSLVRRPSSIEKRISEFIFGSNNGMEKRGRSICNLLIDKECRVLIIGSGEETIITKMLRSRFEHVIGIDVYVSPTVDYVADAHNLPFENDSFDLVIIQSVLEHVLNPLIVVDEIYRVLSQRGIVYAESPFIQQVHEGAYDFFRFSRNAHRWLFRKFTEVESGVTKGPFTALLWSLRYALFSLIGNKKFSAIGCLPFFWIRYLDKIGHGKSMHDGACELYFMGRKSTEWMPPSDIVMYYK